MKTIHYSALLIALLTAVGCASLQTGGEVQWGRQALLEGNNQAALGYFYSAAQRDPNYVYATGSSPRQGVWSYVGRSEYLTGRFPEARKNLERAIASNREEDIARLYLGLTLAREGDRQARLERNRKRDAAASIVFWIILIKPSDIPLDSSGTRTGTYAGRFKTTWR